MESIENFSLPKDNKQRIKLYANTLVALAKYGALDPDIRKFAIEITRNVNKKDLVGQIKSIHRWVRDDRNIKYVLDPYGIDMFRTPQRTLKERAGDCDCKSILTVALLSSIGFPTAFLLVDTKGDGRLNHVLPLARLPDGHNGGRKKWMVLEVTSIKRDGYIPPKSTVKVIIEMPKLELKGEEIGMINELYDSNDEDFLKEWSD